MYKKVNRLLGRKILRPPWQRKEHVPVAVVGEDKSELIAQMKRATESAEIVKMVVEWVPSQTHWRQKIFEEEHKEFLQVTAEKVKQQMRNLSEKDLVKILCAFGEVTEDGKTKKMPKRYLRAKIMYKDGNFMEQISDQIKKVPEEARVAVVRALSRVEGEVGKKLIGNILEEISEEVAKGGVEVKPDEITEIALHCSRKFSNKEFPELINFMQTLSDEISMHEEFFSEDEICDFIRAAEMARFPITAKFSEFVEKKFPITLPTMAWWNLADICAYGNRFPGVFGEEISRRIVNELFKFIPYFPGEDLRKILLFQREISDRRTFRHTLRFLNRRTHELRVASCAEIFPLASLVPKLRTKLGFKISDNIARLPRELLVPLAENLATSDFQLAAAIRRRLETEIEFSDHHRVHLALDRLAVGEVGVRDEAQALADVEAEISGVFDPQISAHQLLRVLDQPTSDKLAMIDEWLKFPGRDEVDLVAGLTALLTRGLVQGKRGQVKSIDTLANRVYNESSVGVEISGCLFLLGAENWWRPLTRVNQYLIHSEVQEISDLLCMLMKLTEWPNRLPDELVKYLEISGDFSGRVIGNSSDIFWPEISGCVKNFRVAGIQVPLALTHLNTRKIRNTKNFRQLIQYLEKRDCGILFFSDERCLITLLRDEVLRSLGFDVRHVRNEDDVVNFFDPKCSI